MYLNILIEIINISLLVIIQLQFVGKTRGESSADGNGLQSVLAELEKISSSLKGIESVNEKLINGLRDNATRYGFKSRNPEDFGRLGYNCITGMGWYKYDRNELSWNEARKSCRKDDAHLAVLNSASEAQVNYPPSLRLLNAIDHFFPLREKFQENNYYCYYRGGIKV